jgi:hypothetical protein
VRAAQEADGHRLEVVIGDAAHLVGAAAEDESSPAVDDVLMKNRWGCSALLAVRMSPPRRIPAAITSAPMTLTSW